VFVIAVQLIFKKEVHHQEIELNFDINSDWQCNVYMLRVRFFTFFMAHFHDVCDVAVDKVQSVCFELFSRVEVC